MTSAGKIVPTEAVAEPPVKGTPISRVNDPTEEVAPTPVTLIKSSAFVDILPTELFASTPVQLTPISKLIEPTAVVATKEAKPTNCSEPSLTSNCPSETVAA